MTNSDYARAQIARVVSITLPYLPEKALSPNGRAHWADKYRAAQNMKTDVMMLMLEHGRPKAPFVRTVLTIRWEAKDKRRRDFDNLLASVKPALDGLVAAGVLLDDDTEHLRLVLEYAREQEADATVFRVEESP